MPTVTIAIRDAAGHQVTQQLSYTVSSPAWPNASNTGVPSGTTLTPSGAITTTSNNQIIDSKDISGGVVVNHTGVIIRKCRIRSSTQYVIRNNAVTGTALLVEDCEIDGLNGTGNSMGFGDRNITVRRCNIHGTENGANVAGTTTLEDSYIHDLYTGGGAHTDGLQFNQGASSITVRHNYFAGQSNRTSCIIMWDEGNPQNSNVLIDNNILDGTGAAYPFYAPRQGPLTNVKVTNNRLRKGVFGGYNGGEGSLLTDRSGNVDDVTGQPIVL